MSAFNLERTELLIGKNAINKLKAAHVAVFGLGGVGGHATEALVRAGIGKLTLVDKDEVDSSNINRQLFATTETIGSLKTVAARQRLLAINPEVQLVLRDVFFLPENSSDFDFSEYDYVLDCVDTVSAKIALVLAAKEAGTPVISAMGAGNKLDASRFEVSDIYKTSVCPLAKVMRKELKARGVKELKVVYSKEEPVSNSRPPGSISFVPPVCGLIMAGEAVRDIVSQ